MPFSKLADAVLIPHQERKEAEALEVRYLSRIKGNESYNFVGVGRAFGFFAPLLLVAKFIVIGLPVQDEQNSFTSTLDALARNFVGGNR
jgi:hypothetical protein